MEMAPFDDAFLTQAGELLARRHRADRRIEPALPERFEDTAVACRAVALAWQQPGACGVAALVDGRLIGYLIGAPMIDTLRGRSAWTTLAGHAVDGDAHRERYRDLYAALAPHWVDIGCFAHYVLVPAADRALLEPWYALSFGQEQVHAIRAIAPAAALPTADPTVTIRRATAADLAALLDLADIVARHLAASPVFAPFLPEARAAWPAGYEALLANPAATILLALRGERATGFLLYAPSEVADDDLLTPERSVTLRLAAVREEERGQGVGRMLTTRMLAEAHAAGYLMCTADWRVTSLRASRFWPRQGFRPVAYRLSRRIDERISWAH
jgi:ribosomal protein S18 acetylase RimI-like enzyme